MGGTEDGFVDLMNSYAGALGMTDTYFTNSTGLPDDNHMTSARDLANLTSKFIKNFPNEYALYNIRDELKYFNSNKITSLLANIQDQSNLETILETFKVETVYHAAAYKHVPLVEENICEGIKNNVFGTISVVKACINKKVSNLVFISSDKAVRPTNIMGASKRLAEMCMQGLSLIHI